MALRDIAYSLGRKLRVLPQYTGIRDFELPASMGAELGRESRNSLSKRFYDHQGRVIHKWTHYLDVYDKYLAHFIGSKSKMLEIGVFEGGSLELWRDYLGPDATIVGIDINPECAQFVSEPNKVRIGSQADTNFLRQVVEEMGGVDVVLDDGSHYAAHQRTSFCTLFPLLNEGGLYIIEDTHTAYWPGHHEGGYKRSGTAIEFAKRLVDDMHAHYHTHAELSTNASRFIPAIHFYDSMIVVEKERRDLPRHIKVGKHRHPDEL